MAPEKVPGLMNYEKIRAPQKKKTIRLTQVYGSMEGSGILELCEAAEEEKAEKDQQKLEKENAKKSKKENFIRCKESCICNEKICKAAGLKECPVCGDVMKFQCSKARCTVENIRSLMKLPCFDVEKKLNSSKKKEKSK